MKSWIKTIATAGLATGMLWAAPGLTVSGTDIQYNGKKIFFSGTNLAWADYNSDVGDSPLDENAWRKAVEGTRKAGGNAIRWWLFNNMSQSPAINTSTHLVSGLKENTINNMKKALDIAEEYGVMVSMCLFSHNLMEPSQWGIYDGKLDIEANTLLFTDEGTQAFIDNALIPVVKAIGNHNALLTWEVFNEPEGMTSVGWTTNKLDKAQLQKFTNKIAAAIHTENSELLVSTGSVNIKYQNWWNDSELIAAGGESNGTLDFFQTHYYPYYQGDSESPFRNSLASLASTYSFDANKPMIIGEFPASGWAGETYTSSMAAKTEISTEECYRIALDSGYAGALAWQYIGDKTESQFGGYTYTIDPALEAMSALYKTDSSFIKIKDVTIEADTGNGMMAVTYGDDNAQIEYQKTFDLSNANTLTFVVKNNGATAAQLHLIFKLTSAWTWTDNFAEPCEVAAGEKKTCSFDISSLTDRNQTLSIVVANYAAGFTGTILYDDFVAGSDTLFNFNEDKYDAFSRGYGNTEQMIPEIKIVFNNENYVAALRTKAVGISKVRFEGKQLQISSVKSARASIQLFNLNGHLVSTLHSGMLSAGTHGFDVAGIPQGVYLLKVKGAGLNFHQTIQIK